MVPTTVERLREGQGGLERVLRSIKMERNYKRSDGSTEKESGKKTIETERNWVDKAATMIKNKNTHRNNSRYK